MATSKTEIADMAAKHLGHSSPINDLDTDKTAVAHACRTFYRRSLLAVLRDFDWPFAKVILTMQLATDDPGDHWTYAYQYPPDCARFRKIQSDVRVDSRYTKIPFERAFGINGSIILTERVDAICEYTKYVENTALFDPDFDLVLSWRLAFYIAPSVTGGDPFKLREGAAQTYQIELANAKQNALGEMVDDDEAPSEFELSRL